MSTVLIIGSSGFIAGKLALRLQKEGKIGSSEIKELILADTSPPPPNLITKACSSGAAAVTATALDLTKMEDVQYTIRELKPHVIFHLAAIVSGDAEANFELGYHVNVDGMRNVLESIRLIGDEYKPRLVFSSSLAVYGPPLPKDGIVKDSHAVTPRGSYGTQKHMAELLLEDYSRKGYVDGMTIRFPTIAIRPGKPNKAASSFISGIIREPLNGEASPLPVPRTFCHPIASPQKAVEYLMQAAALTPQQPGDRTLNVPSISVSIQEMLDAMARVVEDDDDKDDILELVQDKPDPFIANIVQQWPQTFACERATELGFAPDPSYDAIIQSYIRDELGGKVPPRTKNDKGDGNHPTQDEPDGAVPPTTKKRKVSGGVNQMEE